MVLKVLRVVAILHERTFRTSRTPRTLGTSRTSRTFGVLAFVIAGVVLAADARIKPPDNKYTPAQDVQLGQQAAAEIRKQLPMMDDAQARSYVEVLGRR